MMKKILIAAAFALLAAPACESFADDGFFGLTDRNGMAMARSRPWHGNYYHTMYGHPVPLVVPPTANMVTRYGWGVSQSTMTPIYHQFQRPYPGHGVGGSGMGGFRPTPMWPSHTDQFGTYYIRGPW